MELSYPRPDGTFYLSTYPDCWTSHHGAYEGLSVYIVARASKAERIYTNDHLGDAADYSNSLNPRGLIEKLSTVSLCDQAVLDLYEGRLTYG